MFSVCDTVYCFLVAVKKFHVFVDYLATAKLFWRIFVTLCFKHCVIQILTAAMA